MGGGNMSSPGAVVERSTSSGLAEIVELILDKGLVIDVFVRVSLIGIELLTIEARIVVASVDTYLRYAEAINRITATGTAAAGVQTTAAPQVGAGETTQATAETAEEKKGEKA
jgi:gas vesicle structural protein